MTLEDVGLVPDHPDSVLVFVAGRDANHAN